MAGNGGDAGRGIGRRFFLDGGGDGNELVAIGAVNLGAANFLARFQLL
jgi:hypothetical protein